MLFISILFHLDHRIVLNTYPCEPLGPVHTELLATAMQKWMENFTKECVEYPFLAMPTNANDIAYIQCEYSGGSKGGRQGRAPPPPGGPNSFIFMQFSAEKIS